MKDARKEDDYKKWMDFVMRSAGKKKPSGEDAPCIRISNERYAKHATFEDRLTFDDRQFLKEIGIAI